MLTQDKLGKLLLAASDFKRRANALLQDEEAGSLDDWLTLKKIVDGLHYESGKIASDIEFRIVKLSVMRTTRERLEP